MVVRCAASDPDLYPGQPARVATWELEAEGCLTVEVDWKEVAGGRTSKTRNHHTLTPASEPWGSPHAYPVGAVPQGLLIPLVRRVVHVGRAEHRLRRSRRRRRHRVQPVEIVVGLHRRQPRRRPLLVRQRAGIRQNRRTFARHTLD
jgi:hypothetical protein